MICGSTQTNMLHIYDPEEGSIWVRVRDLDRSQKIANMDQATQLYEVQAAVHKFRTIIIFNHLISASFKVYTKIMVSTYMCNDTRMISEAKASASFHAELKQLYTSFVTVNII